MKDENKDLIWFWKRLDDYLSANDLKQTKQRRFIIERFLELEDHTDAETLYSIVREENTKIGLATIYRTLNLLHEAGLVLQHSFADGKAVFELDTPHAHHDHLICVSCGKVVEFENDEIEALQLSVANKYGYRLTSHKLELFGNCPDCQ